AQRQTKEQHDRDHALGGAGRLMFVPMGQDTEMNHRGRGEARGLDEQEDSNAPRHEARSRPRGSVEPGAVPDVANATAAPAAANTTSATIEPTRSGFAVMRSTTPRPIPIRDRIDDHMIRPRSPARPD